jgi:hypothetical protein
MLKPRTYGIPLNAPIGYQHSDVIISGGEIYTRVYKAMRRAGVVVPPSHLRSIVLVHFESLGEWPSFKRLMEPFDQWYSSGIITEEVSIR